MQNSFFMASFDVVNLYYIVPLDKTLPVVMQKLKNYTSSLHSLKLLLNIEIIIELLTFCIKRIYF